jgi:phosphatidylglycerophosphate synthase
LGIEKQKNNRMNGLIYLITILFFLIGGIGIYFAGKKQSPAERQKNRLKFISYFLIINILLGVILFWKYLFIYLFLLIVIAGFF